MIKNITGYNLDNILLNVIYGYYVKYDRLESLINRAYANSGATELNIFINMTDIFTRIDRYLSDRNSIISNPLVITSGLINMVAHYRNFFTTRYRCNTRFWLIESVDNIISKMYCSDFTAPILSDRMTVLKSDNMEVFPMLCKLIPDVQYERCTVDFCTKVVDIIEREKTKSPNMVISKDSFDIQLANTFDLSNITVLRPIKNKEGDNSILSTRYSSINDYIQLISKGNEFIGQNNNPIVGEILPFFMAITRVPTRKLKTMFTIKNAINKLQKMNQAGKLPYIVWNMDEMVNNFISCNPDIKRDPFEILYRYKACDAAKLHYYVYKDTPESFTYNGIENIYDPNAIKSINNIYFSTCPLDLNVL